MAKSENSHTRVEAIRALAKIEGIKDTDIIPNLLTALGDKDKTVQEIATNLLAKYGDTAVPRLLEGLYNEKEAIRSLSRKVLRQIGTTEALKALKSRRP